MNRPKRNKAVPRDFKVDAATLVVNAIKKKRKSAIKFKFDKKSKKLDFKFKKKISKNNAIKNIFNYNFIIKKKIFKEVLKSFIYIIIRRSTTVAGWIASVAIGLDGPDSRPASEALRFAMMLRLSKRCESIGARSRDWETEEGVG